MLKKICCQTTKPFIEQNNLSSFKKLNDYFEEKLLVIRKSDTEEVLEQLIYEISFTFLSSKRN